MLSHLLLHLPFSSGPACVHTGFLQTNQELLAYSDIDWQEPFMVTGWGNQITMTSCDFTASDEYIYVLWCHKNLTKK